MMTRSTVFMALALAFTAASAPGQSTVVPANQTEQQVEIRDLLSAPERTQGMIVNHTDATLRNVVLRVSYSWRWNDERNPGEDTMSFGDTLEVQGEIPPGGSAGFAYMPTRMLPERQDGYYQIDVSVKTFRKARVQKLPAEG